MAEMQDAGIGTYDNNLSIFVVGSKIKILVHATYTHIKRIHLRLKLLQPPIVLENMQINYVYWILV